jgi:RNA polymerase sigma-70 factor (ECF subfamily)
VHVHSHEPADLLAQHLLESRGRFLTYIESQVGDPFLAEDILQDGLLRALRSGPALRDQDRLVSWFFAILRKAIVDTYRRRAVERRHVGPLKDLDVPTESDDETERVLCACFEPLIPTLNADYAELIHGMELRGDSTEDTAERLGITTNNLKVRRHRARQALRNRLLDTCRACAEHGCLDCTCQT